MTQIKNYNYSETEVTMMLKDDTNGEFLWVGFTSDGSNCALQKVSAHNPLQVYFDFDIAVDVIKRAIISGSYIYVAVDDATSIGKRYLIANPLSTAIDFEIPAGITEAPVDVILRTNVYFLIPGNASGTNSKIVEFTISGTFVQTIDLTTVTNADKFTVDANDEIQVVTFTSPAQVVRVFDLDSTPLYSSTEITD